MLEMSPEHIGDYWLPPGEETQLMVSVRRSDCRLPRIEVTSHPDWARVTPGETTAVGVVEVHVAIDAIAAGEGRRGTVALSDSRDSRIRGHVTLDLRAILLEEVHLGMSSQGCPRPGAAACDFEGRSALVDAVAAHPEGGVVARIISPPVDRFVPR